MLLLLAFKGELSSSKWIRSCLYFSLAHLTKMNENMTTFNLDPFSSFGLCEEEGAEGSWGDLEPVYLMWGTLSSGSRQFKTQHLGAEAPRTSRKRGRTATMACK